ncbi:sulfotransferase domain-containing protein [Pseudidiomarina sp. PP-1MA]|uniref:Sulfotransferase domain-containing protein n=1 Tax=Pseudidiomarina sp. PP-1MA TaxID=3237706 RepID=A0AB39X7W8_9GAMM
MSSSTAQLFWLASYPKSGNTWTRSFIAALKKVAGDTDEAKKSADDSIDIDLNELRTGPIASGREWVEQALGFSLDGFNPDEIDALRPDAYRYVNTMAEELSYHKAHDAYSWVGQGSAQQPMFPNEVTRGALYIVRNPLDVCISFANHSKCSIDEAIARMNYEDGGFCKTSIGQANQLRQWLWRWSDHVRSWQQSGLPLKLVRYEDMRLNPLDTFTEIARFLELPHHQEAIEAALELTRFERLQEKERHSGFREKPPGVESFFRKGIVGDWRTTLSPEQVQRIVENHNEVMAELGYLP